MSHRLSYAQVTLGETLGPRTVHVDRARLIQYAGAGLDRNPIHWDERFAASVGLPDVIAHGMFTMAVAVELVSDWAGDGGAVTAYQTKFSGMVVVPYDGGTDIEVRGTVSRLDEDLRSAVVDLTVTCGESKVLNRALATVALG